MKLKSNNKKGKTKTEKTNHLYAFYDADLGYIMPPDVCPFFSTLWEIRREKKKHRIYYSNTKIVKITSITYKI